MTEDLLHITKEGKMSLREGILEEVSNEDYHSDKEYVSSSGLKKMFEKPKAFYEEYVKGQKPFISDKLQEAFDFGSYLHTLILEPHLLTEEYLIYEGEEKQEVSGKKSISRQNAELASKMFNKYNKSTVAIGDHEGELIQVSSFIEGGMAEQTLCTTLDGVKVKVRPDYRREFSDYGQIIDVKTTSEASLTPYQVGKICSKYGYALSAALYVDVVQALTGIEQEFYFLFLSKKGTNQVELFKASEAFLQRGRDQYQIAIKALKKARETGIYYSAKVQELL